MAGKRARPNMLIADSAAARVLLSTTALPGARITVVHDFAPVVVALLLEDVIPGIDVQVEEFMAASAVPLKSWLLFRLDERRCDSAACVSTIFVLGAATATVSADVLDVLVVEVRIRVAVEVLQNDFPLARAVAPAFTGVEKGGVIVVVPHREPVAAHLLLREPVFQ